MSYLTMIGVSGSSDRSIKFSTPVSSFLSCPISPSVLVYSKPRHAMLTARLFKCDRAKSVIAFARLYGT
jgi:hypothetical protein